MGWKHVIRKNLSIQILHKGFNIEKIDGLSQNYTLYYEINQNYLASPEKDIL